MGIPRESEKWVRQSLRALLAMTCMVPALSLAELNDAERVEQVERTRTYVLLSSLDEAVMPVTFFSILRHLSQANENMGFAPLTLDDAAAKPIVNYPFFDDERFTRNSFVLLNQFEPFVWNGNDDEDNRYPEAVGLYGTDGICSGVLVSENRVLTAAHCVCNRRTSFAVFGRTFDNYDSVLAITDHALMPGSCGSDRNGQDLALLTLESSADSPIATMANFTTLGDIASATVVGFGKADGSRPAKVKRYADLVVVSNQCSGTPPDVVPADSERYGCVAEREMVAGSPAWPADSCGGDSGGPLFATVDDRRWLVGITVRAVKTNVGDQCGDGGIYVRLDGASAAWLADLGV